MYITALEQANQSIAQRIEAENAKRKENIQAKLAEIQALEQDIESETKQQVQQGLLCNEEISKLKTIKSYLE